MEKTQLVFIPSPLIGHIVPTVQLAKLLTTMNQHISATILVMKLPSDDKVANYINTLPSNSTPRLKYVEFNLPEESYSHLLSSNTFFFDYVEAHKSKVRSFLEKDTAFSCSVIVVDMFTIGMIDVADELGFDSYVFYTSGAAQLGLKLHLQSLRDDFNVDVTGYKNLDIELAVTTFMNPVSSKLLPSIALDQGSSRVFLDLTRRLRETKGIIVNTFLELESYALQALSEDKNIPIVYTAGPLLDLDSRDDNNQEADIIMKWLDCQPDFSVVFLCFGSQGWFGVEQVKEIAVAIERSGYRFIWSLRRPVFGTDSKWDFPDECENLKEILPQGFLERTVDIGHVIGWAPQMAVLSHPAVGGFVSHCGWNSILESVWCGVPIAAWPIYAEQNTNALQIVKDLGLAVEIKLDYRNDNRMKSAEIVSADVIEDSIKRLMDPKNEIRKKAEKMKEKSRLVLKEGGSSHASLSSFLSKIIRY